MRKRAMQVQNLRSKILSATSVELAWDPVDPHLLPPLAEIGEIKVLHHLICLCPDPDAPDPVYTLTAELGPDARGYIVDGLTPNQMYGVRIIAVCHPGNWGPAAEIWIRGRKVVLPTPGAPGAKPHKG